MLGDSAIGSILFASFLLTTVCQLINYDWQQFVCLLPKRADIV
ncbi:hypothetical protein yfred0001_32680 [Yersinia frederiksenii ATCC 33641]|nr:hypothetical protein yfred0001_32680 [Yersinia frederiksenii ATCC 33641]